MRRYFSFVIILGVVTATLLAAPEPQTARTRIADGFDIPVGPPDGEGYYKARGYRPRGHQGEDWNGLGGGNTDLGDPVFSTAHGLVVYARDARMGWGNVVIIRHVYLEKGKTLTVDSLYGHLDRIFVREGQQVSRGQKVGTIGTNHGMYPAHLHFEIRKNLSIGIHASAFRRDYSNYYSPSDFILSRRTLPGAGRSALVAIRTFKGQEGYPYSGTDKQITSKKSKSSPKDSASSRRRGFRVDRFGDLKSF